MSTINNKGQCMHCIIGDLAIEFIDEQGGDKIGIINALGLVLGDLLGEMPDVERQAATKFFLSVVANRIFNYPKVH